MPDDPEAQMWLRILSHPTADPVTLAEVAAYCLRQPDSSCTSRKLNGNRWYSQTQWLMISGGNETARLVLNATANAIRAGVQGQRVSMTWATCRICRSHCAASSGRRP